LLPAQRLVLLVAAAALAGCWREAPALGEHGIRHVVLISLDTTRADHLGCYGSTVTSTPAIDGLAREGALFADVLAPAPTTLPSHTSMMTGTYPHTHGVVRNGFVVHADNVMLAEILKGAGFHTAAFLGSFAMERLFDFDQGFDHFDEEFEILYGTHGKADQDQRRADAVTDAVLAHVDEVGTRRRLFLFAHYFDAHAPYDPPPAFAPRGDDGQPLAWDPDEYTQAVRDHQEEIDGQSYGLGGVILTGLPRSLVEKATGEPSEIDRKLARLYAGEVEFIDSEIGRLLRGLEGRGVLEDALVVLTGDHGETFWEHGDFWNHGLMAYQTTVHIPLILRFPDGFGAGRRIEQTVSTIDLVSTLCEALAFDEVPARVEGKSLAPLLAGRPFERGAVYCQANQPGWRLEPKDRWGNLYKARVVREGRWKFVQVPYMQGLEQLFDLAADPGEKSDLLRGGAGQLPPEAAAAYARLKAKVLRWVRTHPLLPSQFNSAQAEDALARIKELREHGYVGDEDMDKQGDLLPGATDSERDAEKEGEEGD